MLDELNIMLFWVFFFTVIYISSSTLKVLPEIEF